MTTEPPRTEPLTQEEICKLVYRYASGKSDWITAASGINEGIRLAPRFTNGPAPVDRRPPPTPAPPPKKSGNGIEEGIRRERLRCIAICEQNPELTGYDLARRIRG